MLTIYYYQNLSNLSNNFSRVSIYPCFFKPQKVRQTFKYQDIYFKKLYMIFVNKNFCNNPKSVKNNLKALQGTQSHQSQAVSN